MRDENSGDELDDALYEKVCELSEQGNVLMEEDSYGEALNKFQNALELLPEPKNKWESYTWLKAGTTDAYFLSGDFKSAMDEAFDGMNGPDGVNNEFLLMRLGQCAYALWGADSEKTIDLLAKAYLLGGSDLFQDEDPKYLNLVKLHLK